MRRRITLSLLAAAALLAPLAPAADTLSIEPAHPLPDYSKLTLATNLINTFSAFYDTFAIHDFNHDGRLDMVVAN